MHCVAVIPCLNEAKGIRSVVQNVLPILPNVIVVDDGSVDETAEEAARAGFAAAGEKGSRGRSPSRAADIWEGERPREPFSPGTVEVVRHEKNEGKGAAIQAGLRHAAKRGFEWALLMDGDGQHAAADIPKFLSESSARMVIGNRMDDPKAMPWLRRFVNRWMSACLSRRFGVALPDTQCGFRLVHLPSWSKLDLRTRRFEIESEMLTAFIEAGYPVRFVPIQVIYKKHTSNIDPIVDTVRWFRWWFSQQVKRQRTAAVQNLSEAVLPSELAKRRGVRQSSAAFEKPHAS